MCWRSTQPPAEARPDGPRSASSVLLLLFGSFGPHFVGGLRALSRRFFRCLLLCPFRGLDALAILAFLPVVWWSRHIDTLSLVQACVGVLGRNYNGLCIQGE